MPVWYNHRMSFEMMPQKESGMNEAFAAIASIEAEINAMGANDAELGSNGDLAQIRMKLEKGELSPEHAIAQAEAVRDSKQSYH